MTLVKICGITNFDDALAAVHADADMLGFNFYRSSPRYIDPEEVRLIVDKLPKTVISVGVFVNESLDDIERIASTSGVSVLQLHGDESPDYCVALKRQNLLKVFNTAVDLDLKRMSNYDVQLIMVDAVAGTIRGGTGQLSDWSKARQARELFPAMFLAGGLSPENVSAAIEAVEPFGVDACSSLELAPGKKDHARVRAFVAAVRATTM
ncbi:MAG TPA: phosphoribosylanthranilate isomerase [Pyrinomonadaceae bacterium]|nr:phosphoribosylanthranilate isomerase [Pyrinomonadaceae bacterium]